MSDRNVTENTVQVASNRYSGPASARSELTGELDSGYEGAVYVATDTNATYYWDGAAWTQLAVETNAFSLGSDGPASSFAEVSGSLPTQEVGTDTNADAVVYRTGWRSGEYVGVVFRDGETFTDDTDVAPVIESVASHLKQQFSLGGGDGIGAIAVPQNEYGFASTAELPQNGVGLYGHATYHEDRKPSGPRFRNEGVPDGNALVRFTGSAGCFVTGIDVDLAGTGAYGIRIDGVDRVYIQNVNSVGDMAAGGKSVFVYGSYNSVMRDCFLEQAHFKEDGTAPKNINQWRWSNCDFHTLNPGVAPFRADPGGNWMHNCIFNADLPNEAGLNDGVPCVTGGGAERGHKRYRYTDCQFLGTEGDPMIDNSGRVVLDNCVIGGGSGPLFATLRQCAVTNSRLSPSHEVLARNDQRELHRCSFVGNKVLDANSESGSAAFDLRPGDTRSSSVLVANNVFRSGNGTYDILLPKNGVGSAQITNNYLRNGLTEEWGQAVRGPRAPMITHNVGYNPVRGSRSTPSLPGATATTVSNLYAQPVHVYMDGGSGPYDPTVVDHTGSSVQLSGSPSHVRLDRLGGIEFRSNVPNSWTWYWE